MNTLTNYTRLVPLLLLLVASFAIHAQQPVPTTSDDLYRVGAGDVLEVRVFNKPQLSRDAVRVDNHGMIRMPMIDGEIRASCRSEAELATEIARLYLKYQRNPHVDVFIKEYSSKPVAVMGAVDKPGQFQIQRRVKLLDLVSLAGGPTDHAGQQILVAHSTELSTCEQATPSSKDFDSYNLSSTLRAEDNANPYIQPGDVITIPEAQQIFVVGNVLKPTSISLKEKVTISQAIAAAGGLMPDSKKDRVRILRQVGNSLTKSEIIVDLDAISKHKADDVALQANDIVEVPTSSGKRFFRGLINAVAPTISRTVTMVP